MLYKLLDKTPELLLKALDQSQWDNIEILLDEIENPIHNFDYQKIYEKVLEVKTENEIKPKVLNSIEIAAEKEGIKIRK